MTLQEVAAGSDRKIKVRKPAPCGHCNGSGADRPEAVHTCATCQGRGQVMRVLRQGFTTIQTTGGRAPTAAAPADASSGLCRDCAGEGQVRVEKVVEIHIPPGVEDGQQMRAEGEGEEVADGVPGDLYIVLREEEHPLFERRGADVFAPLRVDLLTAIEGGKVSEVRRRRHRADGCDRPGRTVGRGEDPARQGAAGAGAPAHPGQRGTSRCG